MLGKKKKKKATERHRFIFVDRNTTVAKIMTKGPMCVTSDTSATDALNLMVSRGFRHLVRKKKGFPFFSPHVL